VSVRPIRRLAACAGAATVLLVAGCGGTTEGSGTAASPSAGSTASGGSSTASPSGSATGNGVADLPADQILARAKAALKSADSVRIKGTGRESAQTFSLDLRYSGANTAGTLGVGGQTIELRKLGKVVYLKGSREFWRSSGGEAAAQLLAGKWLKTPANDKRFGDLSELTDLSKAADGLLDPDGTLTKGETKTVNGVQAIGLTSSGKDPGTLYVATTGEPYPLQIASSASSSSQGSLDFLDYGKPVTVSTPPAEQVVDVSKLPGS
jgi:hypothetical protein